MTSRARRQAAERHLDKAFFPAILSCLSWKDQVKASLLCRDMLERVPDATWRTACHERYGECTNCSWFGRPPAPGRPGVLFDGPSIGRDRWLVGSRWTRGDLLCARLPVPPTAGAFSAQTRIAANDEYVVYATDDSYANGDDGAYPLIVRSTRGLGVRAVRHGYDAGWTFALFGGNLVASSAHTDKVKVMSVDEPSLSKTIEVGDDVCCLDGSANSLLVRTHHDVQVWTRVQESDDPADFSVELKYDFDIFVQHVTEAARWAPELSTIDPDVFIATIQEAENGPSRILIFGCNDDFIVPMAQSDPVDSPHLSSRFPYESIAVSGEYVAAVTMFDSWGSYNEDFGIEEGVLLAPRMHVFSAKGDFGPCLWDLAEDIEPSRSFLGSPCVVIVGSLLLSSSLGGLAVCAWCLKSGTFLYRFTGFFEHPHRYANADGDDFTEFGVITSMTLNASKDALLIGCFNAEHFVLDATGGAYLRHTDMHPIRQRQHVISRLLTRLGEKSGLSDDIINTQIAGYLKYKSTIYL